MIFDIKLRGQSDGQVTYLGPVLAPLSIQSCILEEGELTSTLIYLYSFIVTEAKCKFSTLAYQTALHCNSNFYNSYIYSCSLRFYPHSRLSIFFVFEESCDDPGEKKVVHCELCILT